MSGAQVRADVNATSVELLLTDLDTAMVFLDVAEVTGIEETRVRNHGNATHAYHSVLRLLRNLHPSQEQQQRIDEKLIVLKARLQALGLQV